MGNIETTNNVIDNLINDIDRLQVQNRAIKKAYRKLELAFEKKSQELKQLEKSDASKEQSSIDYYRLYRELKAENAELKLRCETIWAIGVDYDGVDRTSPSALTKLIDELVGIASNGSVWLDANDNKIERFVGIEIRKGEKQ